jgi:hypothetical protein
MSQGPLLIFDKSTLHGLNLDEAEMPDHFYMSTITPLFFVECLADLEQANKRNIPPEQVVGRLAARTPDLHTALIYVLASGVSRVIRTKLELSD